MNIDKKRFLAALSLSYKTVKKSIPPAPVVNGTIAIDNTVVQDRPLPQEQETSPAPAVNHEVVAILPTAQSQAVTQTGQHETIETLELDLDKLTLLLVLSEKRFHPGTNRRSSYQSIPNIQTVIEKHKLNHRNLWPSVLSLLKGQTEIEGKIAVFKFKENTSLTYDSACASTFQDDILNQANKAEIIVFDFKNVHDLDVTILGTLHSFHKSLLRSNRQIVFIHTSDLIKERLGNEFLICDSLSEVIPFIEADKIKKYKV